MTSATYIKAFFTGRYCTSPLSIIFNVLWCWDFQLNGCFRISNVSEEEVKLSYKGQELYRK